jgi:hypothetical protein
MRVPALVALLSSLLACSHAHLAVPVEPTATFAAHREGEVFVLDRARTGTPAVVEPPGRFSGDNAPDLILRPRDGDPIGLWIVGRSRVIVRDGTSTLAPRTDEVVGAWDDGGALRLALHARDGTTLAVDPFARPDDGRPSSRLARGADADTGTYRAIVRDAHGDPVGWLRVSLSGAGGAERIYDAALPASVDDGLAVAAVVALDAEFDWIEGHRPSH